MSVCVLDGAGVCTGCLRTIDEIARWTSMSAEEQWLVIAALERRRLVKQMDAVERIKSELSSSPVVLFMKGTPDFPQCGFSAQAVAALRALSAKFKHVNIFEEPELREALKRYSNWPTYPQLYVNGELEKLLEEAGVVTA